MPLHQLGSRKSGPFRTSPLHLWKTPQLSRLSTHLRSHKLRRVTPINLLHDPLCPPDSICNGTHRGWNPCSAVVLRQFSRRKNAGSDQQHALATFVHEISVAYSPFVRYNRFSREASFAYSPVGCLIGLRKLRTDASSGRKLQQGCPRFNWRWRVYGRCDRLRDSLSDPRIHRSK